MKVDRILSIIMLLLHRKIISAPELSKIFDVSVRTIYRDIETISHAGIPIVTETGVKGGISILEDFKIDKYLFSASDIASTMLALTNIYPNLLESDNSYILAKHKSLVSAREQKKSGITNKMSVIRVTLRFHESHKDEISEYYDLNITSLEDDGYYKGYIYIENSEREYNNILILGDKCECLEPIHVREYIKNKIKNINKFYDM